MGIDFKELKQIIDLIDNKDRIGVCIDTCHLFASGVNITTPSGIANMVASFDKIIGLKYLKAMHLNDSVGTLGSNRDAHLPLGEGEIGLDAFRQIMNCDELRGIPLILETPYRDDSDYGPNHQWAKEIQMLRGLIVRSMCFSLDRVILKSRGRRRELLICFRKPRRRKKRRKMRRKVRKK